MAKFNLTLTGGTLLDLTMLRLDTQLMDAVALLQARAEALGVTFEEKLDATARHVKDTIVGIDGSVEGVLLACRSTAPERNIPDVFLFRDTEGRLFEGWISFHSPAEEKAASLSPGDSVVVHGLRKPDQPCARDYPGHLDANTVVAFFMVKDLLKTSSQPQR